MPTATIEAPPAERRLIRLRRVCDRLGVSRASVYRELERDPAFPRPVRLRGVVLYVADEVDAYIARLADAR